MIAQKCYPRQLSFETTQAPPINTLQWRGMMWFDPNPKTSLTSKIIHGKKFYTDKYNSPQVVVVNPSMMPRPAHALAAEIMIHTSRIVLNNHFWFGDLAGAPGQAIKGGNE